MKKVTPSPPYSLNNSKLHEAAQRAFKHYALHSQLVSASSEKLFSTCRSQHRRSVEQRL